MQLRPCIDIHNGKVKQIVGGTLSDKNNQAVDNFVSRADADYYANIYKEKGLSGGHVIILNKKDSEYYEESLRQAKLALKAFPNGMMVGGGINADNALDYIRAGASHVIVTSYAFFDGNVDYDRLLRLKETVGKESIVLDLSCRKKGDDYYIVTDRWQKFTNLVLCEEVFESLSEYCDEFLVHAVDVEGKKAGIDEEVVALLSRLPYTVTYAGGISTFDDINKIKQIGNGKIDVTIGSALSLFGGTMDFEEVIACIQ